MDVILITSSELIVDKAKWSCSKKNLLKVSMHKNIVPIHFAGISFSVGTQPYCSCLNHIFDLAKFKSKSGYAFQKSHRSSFSDVLDSQTRSRHKVMRMYVIASRPYSTESTISFFFFFRIDVTIAITLAAAAIDFYSQNYNQLYC